MGVSVFDLFGELRMETGGFKNSLRQADNQLKSTARTMDTVERKARVLGSSFSSAGQTLSLGITAPLTLAAAAFIKSATSIDAMRNKLVAATGSIDGANSKMRELRQLAQANAGVFTQGAVEMYAFLKPMKLGESVIENLIKATGRLKLANEDLDISRFAFNLDQLFSQQFERADLKEAIGNFPRMGEILQKAFDLSGSDLGTVGEQMKNKLASGMSKGDFFAKIADAIQNDPSLSKLSDTVGIRFQKMMERVFVAIEPLGNTLLSVLEPVVAKIVPIIERMGAAFAEMTPFTQTLVLAFAGIAAAIGPVLVGVGALITAVTSIAGAVTALGGLSVVLPVIAAVGVAILQAAGYAALLYSAWQANFGGIRDLTATIAAGIVQLWNASMPEVSSIADRVTREAKQFWEANGADIIRAVQKISNGVKAVWTPFAQFWAENGQNIMQATSAAWEQVKTVIIGAVRVIGNVIKLVAAVINGDWSKAWEALSGIAMTALQAAIGVIRGSAGIAVAAIKIMLNGILALGGWIAAQGASLAVSLATGFIGGIRAQGALIASTVANVFTAPILAAKGVLGIQSPSKVFFQIGKDVAQGFIDGLASMKTGIYASLADAFDVTKIKGLTKKDASGVELLTSLIKQLDELTPRTKLQATLAELTAGKYAGMNTQLREMIVNLAKKLTLIDSNKKAMQALLDRYSAFQQAHPLDPPEIPQEGLRYPGIGTPLGGGETPGAFDFESIREMLNDLADLPPKIKPQWDSFWGTMLERLKAFKDGLPSIKQALGENLLNSIMGVTDVLTNAFQQWRSGADTFFGAFAKGFGQMISQVISDLVRLMLYKAILSILTSAIGGTSFGKFLGLPGPASVPGRAGAAEGGLISGPGTGTSDSIWARISNGEFVVKAKAVAHYGADFFHRLNAMRTPAMAFAGGGMYGGGRGSSSSVFNNQRSNHNVFNINVSGGSAGDRRTATQIKNEIIHSLRSEEMRNG